MMSSIVTCVSSWNTTRHANSTAVAFVGVIKAHK